jgi:hypothetical protein
LALGGPVRVAHPEASTCLSRPRGPEDRLRLILWGEIVFRQRKSRQAALGHDPVDPVDPVIAQGAARLQRELSSLVAVDHNGDLLGWEDIARIVLGHLGTSRVRDALTADALSQALVPLRLRPEPRPSHRAVSPEISYRGPDWAMFLPARQDEWDGA